MDGAVLSHSTWHIHYDGGLAAAIYRIDMSIEEDIRTDFLAVVGVVPELLHDFVCIVHALNDVSIFLLFHTKNDYSAIGVRKGGIAFPKGFGQSTFGLLEFHAQSFWFGNQPHYVF